MSEDWNDKTLKPAVNLSTLAKTPIKALTAKQIEQVQYWIDADWESHDIDRDAVTLIKRLLITIRDGIRE